RFSCDSSLPVDPNGFPFEFARSDAVVAAVPERFGFDSKSLSETLSQELAVGLGPARGQVMPLQVSCSSERVGIRTAGLMLRHVVTQDGFAQPARSAVN